MASIRTRFQEKKKRSRQSARIWKLQGSNKTTRSFEKAGGKRCNAWLRLGNTFKQVKDNPRGNTSPHEHNAAKYH
eukprot:6525869-Ditylum_brightwellii.AAC.1